jgi:hypothetical protein
MRPHYITPPPEEVLPLFAQPAARRTDPETSHQAAVKAKAFAGRHAAAILEALRAGPAGQTEIAKRCGLLPHQCGKRLSELCRTGDVALTGRWVVNGGGCREREWQVTAASR